MTLPLRWLITPILYHPFGKRISLVHIANVADVIGKVLPTSCVETIQEHKKRVLHVPLMPNGFVGKGGIGLGVARAIAAAGAHVSIWGTNPKKNTAAIQELQAINPSASVLLCDVSDENAVEDSMAKVIDRYGRIDACFPNAGIGSQNQKPFFEHSSEDWFKVIDVNLHGVFFTLRAATRQMVKQGEGGSLILTSSGTAIQGAPKAEAYASTKGGMIAMMMSLSVEMARYKITANAVLSLIHI